MFVSKLNRLKQERALALQAYSAALDADRTKEGRAARGPLLARLKARHRELQLRLEPLEIAEQQERMKDPNEYTKLVRELCAERRKFLRGEV
jgi:hypothetical protein